MGGAVASWLVRVRAQAGDTVLTVFGQDTLLSQCLSSLRSINGYRPIVGET